MKNFVESLDREPHGFNIFASSTHELAVRHSEMAGLLANKYKDFSITSFEERLNSREKYVCLTFKAVVKNSLGNERSDD